MSKETFESIVVVVGLVAIFYMLGILFREMTSAWIAINNHKAHGTYDKVPDSNHKCTHDCKRPLVKQDNGIYYCAWCDVEYRCKYVRKEGESCTLNNKCTYSNCKLIKKQ